MKYNGFYFWMFKGSMKKFWPGNMARRMQPIS